MATVEDLQRIQDLLLSRRRRRDVRKSLAAWARFCGFEPARHHRLLIERLAAVEAGQSLRLLVTMPPGSAKSTYSSILFPGWYLARNPSSHVIAASHTVELAEKFGRRVRNLLAEHGMLLGVSLSDDSKAAGRWSLTAGAEYYAAGAGVGIAGFRADLAIIDDPIRSREDADSKPMRERIWEWFKSDLSPRLRPGGQIVLIQTRWHEDDLAGRILAEMVAKVASGRELRGGERWEVLSLPAIAEPGDALGRAVGEFLWTDGDYGYADFLAHERASQTPRNWSALYQQVPAPERGVYFQAEWLRPYIHAPARETLSIYGASDYAVTADGGDYTVHIVVGMDPSNQLWLLDLWRGQASSEVWVRTWCDLVKKWRPFDWAEETGQITAGIGPFRDMQALAAGAYCNIELFPTRRSKAIRAQSIRGRMALGGLYVPEHAPWYSDFRAELLAFDAGAHDDQVDALGLIGQLLDQMVPGRLPQKPEPVEVRPGYRRLDDVVNLSDWKASL